MNRRLRVLLVVDVVLAAALVALWFADRPAPPVEFTVPALDALTAVEITRTGQPAVRLERSGDGWRLAGDGPTGVDPQALAALTTTLAKPIGADQAVDADGADLDAFGVGPHAIAAHLTGPGVDLRLRVGKTIDGRRTFVWPIDGPQVYRLRADLRAPLDRTAIEWAARRLWSVDLNQIARLETRRGERLDWVAERDGPDQPWRLVHPAGRDASEDALGSVATTFSGARADAFEPVPEGWRPLLTLSGRTFDGQTVEVQLDRPDADGRVRARLAGGSSLFVLPRHQAVFLDARADDLRDRRVLPAAVTAERITAVAVGGPDPVRVERRADGRWRATAPEAIDPLPVAPVDGWLAALVGLQAVGFAERPPPNAFEPVVHRLDLVAGTPLTIEVGSPFGSGHHLRVSDRPDRVLVVGQSALEVLRPRLEALTAAPADPAQPR